MLQLATFAGLCIAGSFLIGIQSAGDMQPFARSEAQQADLLGVPPLLDDSDGDGRVTPIDALRVLEAIRDPKKAKELRSGADIDGDGHLTIDDAIDILHLATR